MTSLKLISGITIPSLSEYILRTSARHWDTTADITDVVTVSMVLQDHKVKYNHHIS